MAPDWAFRPRFREIKEGNLRDADSPDREHSLRQLRCHMFNLGRWSAAWTCFGMLLYPAVSSRTAAAAEPPPAASPAPAAEQATISAVEAQLDVSFIPAEAAAALVVHPQSVLTGPNAEWMPVEVITAAGLQQYGFDPVQIQEAILCAAPPPAATPTADPGVGLILRFAEPYAKAPLMAKLAEAKQIKAEGQTVYVVSIRDEECVCLPDDHTILFAKQPTLLQMLAAKDVESPLVKLLKHTDCSGTYTALASVDALRDLLTGVLAKMPPLPPPLDQFRKLPLLVSSAKLRLNIHSGADFSLTLHAVDDEAAGELLDLTNNALTMARQAVLGQMQQGMRPNADDPVQQASAKYIRASSLAYSTW